MEPLILACRADGMPTGWMEKWYGMVGKEKAARLRRMPERKAALSLVGELLARYGVGKEAGVRAQEIQMGREPSGKPIVVFPQGHHFNISHSGDWCVCAVARVPVGIDIQRMDEVRFGAIARRYFQPEEQLQYERAEDRKRMFYTLWTKREALGKCVGVGLRPLPETLPPMVFRWKTWEDYRLCVCWESP